MKPRKNYFSKELSVQALKHNTNERTILFCQLVATGADPTDAHAALFPPERNTTREHIKTEATIKLKDPTIKLIADKFRRNAKRITNENVEEYLQQIGEEVTEEERGKILSHSGIIDSLIALNRSLGGKDKLSCIQSIAKLSGLDKPEEKAEEERRKYFLPFVSRCQNCELMRIYCSLYK